MSVFRRRDREKETGEGRFLLLNYMLRGVEEDALRALKE